MTTSNELLWLANMLNKLAIKNNDQKEVLSLFGFCHTFLYVGVAPIK